MGKEHPMIYEDFLTLKGKDFKGRKLDDIWSFSDKVIAVNELGKKLVLISSHSETRNH